MKQVADQEVMIKDLKKKLYEREYKEMKSLQGQIDDLVEKNMEKERAIQKLENDFNDIKVKCVIEEAVLTEALVNDKNEKQVTLEEVIVSQERCKAETVKKATIKYVHKCLKQVEKLEAEIS